MTAMTAATIDLLTGGRFLLGMGASGPQVVEGWHGVVYGKLLTRTREYVEIVRMILKRDEPARVSRRVLRHTGYGRHGAGQALKADQFIRFARTSPSTLRRSARRMSRSPQRLPTAGCRSSFRRARGRLPRIARRRLCAPEGRKVAGDFDIAPTVTVVVGDDVDACRNQVKPKLALYIGGMGARGKNFYNDLACRYGYEEAAAKIQELYLSGKKNEAIAAVPDELVDEVALCGPRERIRDRLGAWREAGVTTLICGAHSLESIRAMAEVAF